MINDIKSAIIAKLKEIYPTILKRYTDDNVPQNFKTPSFFVSVIDQDYRKRMNVKSKSMVSFDVVFFSDKNTASIKSDCLDKQEVLLRCFDIIGTTKKFRVMNKSAQITDNVLHLTFDVNYSEIKEEAVILMQEQTTNTNL